MLQNILLLIYKIKREKDIKGMGEYTVNLQQTPYPV